MNPTWFSVDPLGQQLDTGWRTATSAHRLFVFAPWYLLVFTVFLLEQIPFTRRLLLSKSVRSSLPTIVISVVLLFSLASFLMAGFACMQEGRTFTCETPSGVANTLGSPAKTSGDSVDGRLSDIEKLGIDLAPFEQCLIKFDGKAQQAANRRQEAQQFFCKRWVFTVNGPDNISSEPDCLENQADTLTFIGLDDCLLRAFRAVPFDSIKPVQVGHVFNGATFSIPFWRSFKPGDPVSEKFQKLNQVDDLDHRDGLAGKAANKHRRVASRGTKHKAKTTTEGAQSGQRRYSSADRHPRSSSGGARAQLVGVPSVLGGSFSAESAQRSIAGRLPSIGACARSNFVEGRTVQGNIRVKLDVKKTGVVKRVSAVSSTLNNGKLQRCMMRELKRARFPNTASGRVEIVHASLNFTD